MLDLIYAGLIEKEYDNLNLIQYVTKLANTDSVREWAADKASDVQQHRKKLYDRNSR